MASNRPRRFSWHTLVVAALTLGLVVVFLRSINPKEAWQAVRSAHLWWIVVAVFGTLCTYGFRTIRWQALLRPIGRASFRNAFRTTVIGFAINVPLARAGEVVRPYLLARREGMDPAATFATIVVERLLDLCVVLMLFFVALLGTRLDVSRDVRIGGSVLAIGAVSALLALFVLARRPERLSAVVAVFTARLPPKLAKGAEHLVETFAQGLVVLRRPRDLAAAFFWSVPVWLSIALGIMLTSWAFDLRMTFVDSFLVVGFLTVGVAVPTPAAAGGFEAAYLMAATEVFKADPSTAGAAAIVLHLVSFVPVLILGLVYMWQDGLTLGSLQGLTSEAQAAEQPGASVGRASGEQGRVAP